MRKLLTLTTILFGILALLSSCKHDDVMNVSINDEQMVSICVTIPDSETRASETNSAQGIFNNNVLGDENDNNTMRYILQIFDDAGRPSDETLIEYSDGTTVSFPVRLVPGRDYTFVVWADFVTNGETNTDNHYITKDANGKTDLRNITINEDSWVAMDETRDAFTGIYSTKAVGEKYNGASTIDVELTRPFAKVRVVTTDLVALANLGIKPDYATVEYTTPYRAGFNALTCQPFEAEQNDKKTHQVSDNEAFAIVAYGDNTAANKVLFTDYLFASADQNDVVKFDLSVYEKADKSGPIKSNSFSTDIAIKRNHLTTISGNILTDGGTVNVVIDPTFGGYIEEEYPFDNTIDPNKAIYYTATKKIENSSWNIDTFGANIVSNTWNESTGEGVIVFDGEVTMIGDAAFQSSDITNIVIPDSVTEIGRNAFAWCEDLSNITIPANVEIIKEFAFYESNIREITFKTSKLTHIGDGAFFECDELVRIDIPSSVTNIGGSVFRGCTKLQRINIPIPNQGKYYSVGLPDSIALLSHDYDAYTSTIVAYPAGATTETVSCYVHPYVNIAWAAFWDCDYIVDVRLSIIRSIEWMNFCYCDKLKSINLDEANYIASQVLSYCDSLEELSLPSIETIGVDTFCYNKSLKSIDFGSENLTEINTIANSNASLETIYIGSSVSTIKDSFDSCPKLANIYVKATAVPALSSSFDAIPADAKIYVPVASYWSYVAAEGWADLKDHIVAYDYDSNQIVDTPNIAANNIITYIADGKVEESEWTSNTFGANIVSNEWNASTGEGIITFDDEVTKIGYNAFYSCGLTGITIPNSVTEIGGAAFAFCSGLTSIVIPDSVETIDTAAFSHCANLTSVTVSKNISSIGLQAFVECDAMSSFYCKATTPPNINWMAFYMIDSNFVIYVPTESIDAYKTAAGWSDYADQIVGYNFE